MVKAHIETELVPDRKLDLAPETSLTGIVDSSGMLELVIWIESSFGVSVELGQIAPRRLRVGSQPRRSDPQDWRQSQRLTPSAGHGGDHGAVMAIDNGARYWLVVTSRTCRCEAIVVKV